MTKQELVEFIATEANMSKAEALRALDATLAGITEALKKGGKVSLVGFGTFAAKERAAREGINPLTKEKILNIGPLTSECGNDILSEEDDDFVKLEHEGKITYLKRIYG